MIKPWTEADIGQLRGLVAEGLSLRRIALELGRGAPSVAGKMDYLGLSLREARRETWHRHLSALDRPAYRFDEMGPIVLAVQRLVEQGCQIEWCFPDHVRIDGTLHEIRTLPAMLAARAQHVEAAE